MTVQDFFFKWNLKGINADGAYGNQCADVPVKYNQEVVGGGPFAGNAIDFQHNYDRSAYAWVANTPEGVPIKGDIVIWGDIISQYGHVAIFDHGDVNSFVSFDQNWPLTLDSNGNGVGVCHFQNHTYHGVLGWLHPEKDVNSEPEPISEPAPQPVAVPEPVPVPEPVAVPDLTPVPEPVSPDPVIVPEGNLSAPNEIIPAPPEALSDLPGGFKIPETGPIIATSTTGEKVPWTGGNSWFGSLEQEVAKEFETLTKSTMSAKSMLTDLIHRLLSRKLWLTVVTAAYFAFHGDMNQATAVVMTYLGVNAFGPK